VSENNSVLAANVDILPEDHPVKIGQQNHSTGKGHRKMRGLTRLNIWFLWLFHKNTFDFSDFRFACLLSGVLALFVDFLVKGLVDSTESFEEPGLLPSRRPRVRDLQHSRPGRLVTSLMGMAPYFFASSRIHLLPLRRMPPHLNRSEGLGVTECAFYSMVEEVSGHHRLKRGIAPPQVKTFRGASNSSVVNYGGPAPPINLAIEFFAKSTGRNQRTNVNGHNFHASS
jgi:hypothetical protein